MSITTAQAEALLEYTLFESPTLAAANAPGWVTLSGASSVYASVAEVASAMSITAEGGISDQVVRYYESALGRVPSGIEVAYYVKIAESGLTGDQIAQGPAAVPAAAWSQIAEDFGNSPEFAADLAGAHGSSNVIITLYENVLGRVPGISEVAYYLAQMDDGADAAHLLQEFANSPEFRGKTDAAIQQTLAGYGALLGPTGGPTPFTSVSDALASFYAASPAATYATAPSAVLARHGSVTVGLTDTAALTLDPQIDLGSAVTTSQAILAKLESGLAAHHVAYGVYGGNTYMAESLTGTPGATDTTVVELTGVYGHVSVGQSLVGFTV